MTTDVTSQLTAAYDFTDRIGVISGASRGLGRNAVRLLTQAGAHIVAVARSAEDLRSLRDDLSDARGSVIPFAADLGSAEVFDNLSDRVTELVGNRIDFLVNNAGTLPTGPIEETSVAEWDRVLALNVRSPGLVTGRLLDHLLKSDAATVVNVASIHAFLGISGRAIYAASKGAVVAMTRQLAIELAPKNIRVNAVCPGVIATPMSEQFLQDPNALARLEQKIPLGRIGQPYDVTAAIAYLTSPASAYVTGQALIVDGGWTAA